MTRGIKNHTLEKDTRNSRIRTVATGVNLENLINVNIFNFLVEESKAAKL